MFSTMTFLGLRSAAFHFRLPTGVAHDVFGKLFASRFTVPLFKGRIRDFSLDEKLCEFSPLSLALEGQCSSELLFAACLFYGADRRAMFFTSVLNSSSETPSFLAQSLRS